MQNQANTSRTTSPLLTQLIRLIQLISWRFHGAESDRKAVMKEKRDVTETSRWTVIQLRFSCL